MEKIINQFIDVAAKANDFKLILAYQWVLSEEATDEETINGLLEMKAKGY